MTVFATRVTQVGAEAAPFFAEGILVLFGEGCPPELQGVSVIHSPSLLTGEVQVGDLLRIGDVSFEVTAVGDVVNRNLRNLGHLVVKFNGLTQPELPGDLCVARGDVPPVQPGTVIRIERPATDA